MVKSRIYTALALVCLFGGIAFYVYVMGLACAFGSASGACDTVWPWQLRGTDLIYLVLLPSGLTLMFALLARRARR